MNGTELVQRARDAGVQLVSFLYCDNGGVIRGSHIAGFKLPHCSALKEDLTPASA